MCGERCALALRSVPDLPRGSIYTIYNLLWWQKLRPAIYNRFYRLRDAPPHALGRVGEKLSAFTGPYGGEHSLCVFADLKRERGAHNEPPVVKRYFPGENNYDELLCPFFLLVSQPHPTVAEISSLNKTGFLTPALILCAGFRVPGARAWT